MAANQNLDESPSDAAVDSEENIDAEFSLSQEAAGFVTDWRGAADWPERNRLMRKRLDHLLHTKAFQILVICLVLFDAVIVIAELAIDLGLLESSGKSALQHSIWPHLFHAISLAILSFFMLETCVKLYAMGARILRHKMELFDIFVIVISFGLDIASAVPGSTLTALFGLIVVLRLWRLVRIANSIAVSIRIQGRKALAKQSELRKRAEGKCSELEAKVAELESGLVEALDLIEGCPDVVRRLRDLLPTDSAPNKSTGSSMTSSTKSDVKKSTLEPSTFVNLVVPPTVTSPESSNPPEVTSPMTSSNLPEVTSPMTSSSFDEYQV